MITLQSDQLVFTFPEIDAAIQRLGEAHIDEALPRILAENREPVIDSLATDYRYRRANREWFEKAAARLRTIGQVEIERALRAACAGCGYRPNQSRTFQITFHRTLRIPDDGKTYPLPASLGRFPVRGIDDYADSVPAEWLKRGGVLMPMYQSEALWIDFSANYPLAVKVAAGKIDAVSGEAWAAGLQQSPQNYLVVPEQPWLDGFSVGKGVIRQFVAMPLGSGYSVEEQLTGKADVGGIQVQVYPMKAEAWFREELAEQLPTKLSDLLDYLIEAPQDTGALFARSAPCAAPPMGAYSCVAESAMGLGAGGQMRQEIYADPHNFGDWDTSLTRRCFVHLCNSLIWRQITGSNPPHPPLTAVEYKKSGIPWFDYYRDDLEALAGSERLSGVKSVVDFAKAQGHAAITGNTTIAPDLVIQHGNARRPNEVRESVEW